MTQFFGTVIGSVTWPACTLCGCLVYLDADPDVAHGLNPQTLRIGHMHGRCLRAAVADLDPVQRERYLDKLGEVE